MANRKGPTEDEVPDLAEELSRDEVASTPGDTSDPREFVAGKLPPEILKRYEVYSYRNAAAILAETRREEFEDILSALRSFALSTTIIRTAGGNESQIPKLFSRTLRPLHWYETVVQGDLLVKKTWRQQVDVVAKGKRQGMPIFGTRSELLNRQKYLDGHKVDYVKGRVAFDLEWNSKDQTFDRDLYAFSAFFQTGVIDVGVLITRSASLNEVFKAVGPALKKDGVTPDLTQSGKERPTAAKYGASTTWMGKLLYRLNAGRNGGCPVLAIGITPACVTDWPMNKGLVEI